jgi:hypothetical protein
MINGKLVIRLNVAQIKNDTSPFDQTLAKNPKIRNTSRNPSAVFYEVLETRVIIIFSYQNRNT